MVLARPVGWRCSRLGRYARNALNAAGCERVFEESMSGPCRSLAACRRLGVRPRVDVWIVARLDRLARSMRQLLTTDIGRSSTCSEIPLADRR